jgi:hypothetical protein
VTEFLVVIAAIAAIVVISGVLVAVDAAREWWTRDQPQYVNVNNKRLVELMDLQRRQEHER